MQYSIKKAKFNKKTGKSYVIIQTQLGDFSGFCKLHDEDKDIASRFFGCEVAEMRAIAKFFKAQKRILIAQYNCLNNLHKNLENMNGFNRESLEARKIRKNSFILKEEINKMQLMIDTLSQRIYDKIKNYREEKAASLEHIQKKIKKAV